MADRVAVFVDAGYLFAQGSAALSGSKQRRVDIAIDAQKVVEALKTIALDRAESCSLLRIYWYDGAIGGSRPTTDQALLAHLDDVKLRLGFVNNAGQQKGVDSLIVTDLIELARQKSICDAVLMSGDEDVRVGVQIAQNYGVRVHLIGIAPSRGTQSHQLLQEADTTHEVQADWIGTFLSIRGAQSSPAEYPLEPARPIGAQPYGANTESQIAAVVRQIVGAFSQSDLDGVLAYWERERGVPKEFDGRILVRCREVLGRTMDRTELRFARTEFQRFVRVRSGGQ